MKVRIAANVKYGNGKILPIGHTFDTEKLEDKEAVAAIEGLVASDSRAVHVLGTLPKTKEDKTTEQGVTAGNHDLGAHRLQGTPEEEDEGDGSGHGQKLKKK